MKKLIALLCIAVLLCTSTVCVFAIVENGQAVFTVDRVTGNSGDTVTVKINLTNNPGIMALRFTVSYDASRLEIISVEDNEDIVPFLTDTDLNNNPLVLLWNLYTEEFTETGVLATLKFKIKDDATSAECPITVSYRSADCIDVNLKKLDMKVTGGNITVIGGESGEESTDDSTTTDSTTTDSTTTDSVTTDSTTTDSTTTDSTTTDSVTTDSVTTDSVTTDSVTTDSVTTDSTTTDSVTTDSVTTDSVTTDSTTTNGSASTTDDVSVSTSDSDDVQDSNDGGESSGSATPDNPSTGDKTIYVVLIAMMVAMCSAVLIKKMAR